MKYEKLARFIIKNVGGEKNINIVQHCATRLRFELKDEEKVNKVNLENSSEILQVLFSGGQCQVVIGTHVADVYKAILATAKMNSQIKIRNYWIKYLHYFQAYLHHLFLLWQEQVY